MAALTSKGFRSGDASVAVLVASYANLALKHTETATAKWLFEAAHYITS